MIKEKTTIATSLSLVETKTIIGASLIAGIILFPTFIHNQLITGPIINALLIVSTITLGTTASLTLGLIPSLIALSRGLLPVVLAPAVPFIMASNAIYILLFARFIKKNQITNKNFALGVVSGSIAKFAFLASISQLILPRLFSSAEITQKAAFMLSLPQLATALIGGLFAFLIYKGIKYAS